MRPSFLFLVAFASIYVVDGGILIRMCGKRLSTIMEKMCTRAGEASACYAGLSSYQDDSVGGQVGGIADKCCNDRCAYDQLNSYCCSKEEADAFYEMIRGKREVRVDGEQQGSR